MGRSQDTDKFSPFTEKSRCSVFSGFHGQQGLRPSSFCLLGWHPFISDTLYKCTCFLFWKKSVEVAASAGMAAGSADARILHGHKVRSYPTYMSHSFTPAVGIFHFPARYSDALQVKYGIIRCPHVCEDPESRPGFNGVFYSTFLLLPGKLLPVGFQRIIVCNDHWVNNLGASSN